MNIIADKLYKVCSKKIDTTMIGSLDAVETILKDFIEELDDESQKDYLKLYRLIREKILDNGNTQKRNLRKEFEKYNITPRVYQYEFKMRDE